MTTTTEVQDTHVKWLPCKSVHVKDFYLVDCDKIDILPDYLNNPTYIVHSSPDIPPQEFLNHPCALRSVADSSCFTARTVPTFYFTSFVTDSQQSPWSTQSQPLRHPTPTNTTTPVQTHNADFLLFPSHNAPSPPARRISEPVQGISRTHPNNTAFPGSPAVKKTQQHLHQRASCSDNLSASAAAASSASPAQNPRVNAILHGSGFGTSAHPQRSYTIGNTMQNHFTHSYSTPASTISQRPPPVPTFPDSNMERFTADYFDQQGLNDFPGTTSQSSSIPSSILTCPDSAVGYTFPDNASMGSGLPAVFPNQSLPAPFMRRNYSDLSSATATTMSPYDMHKSTPASGVMTDFSTPRSEDINTPTFFSHRPSPYLEFDGSPSMHDNQDFDNGLADLPQMFPDLPGKADEEVVRSVQVSAQTDAVPLARKAPSQEISLKSPRISQAAGVKKSRKKPGPLGPVKIDPEDPKSCKRGRNTLAARNSRARRQLRMEQLEKDVELWKARAEALGWRPGDADPPLPQLE